MTPSLSDVVDEVAEPLLRYLTRYTGDPDLAEDLLQETFMRIGRALPTYQGRAELKTWAFSIATHAAADHFRQPANRVTTVAIDESAEIPNADRPVDDGVVIDEMNTCVREVIDSLPEDYRAALVLHDLEGMSAAQTAFISGCTLATAKIRIHRARARLAERLRGACDFYRDAEDVFRCEEKSPRS